jgi:hypothetical protein
MVDPFGCCPRSWKLHGVIEHIKSKQPGYDASACRKVCGLLSFFLFADLDSDLNTIQRMTSELEEKFCRTRFDSPLIFRTMHSLFELSHFWGEPTTAAQQLINFLLTSLDKFNSETNKYGVTTRPPLPWLLDDNESFREYIRWLGGKAIASEFELGKSAKDQLDGYFKAGQVDKFIKVLMDKVGTREHPTLVALTFLMANVDRAKGGVKDVSQRLRLRLSDEKERKDGVEIIKHVLQFHLDRGDEHWDQMCHLSRAVHLGLMEFIVSSEFEGLIYVMKQAKMLKVHIEQETGHDGSTSDDGSVKSDDEFQCLVGSSMFCEDTGNSHSSFSRDSRIVTRMPFYWTELPAQLLGEHSKKISADSWTLCNLASAMCQLRNGVVPHFMTILKNTENRIITLQQLRLKMLVAFCTVLWYFLTTRGLGDFVFLLQGKPLHDRDDAGTHVTLLL